MTNTCRTLKRCQSISRIKYLVGICWITGEQNGFIQIRLFSWNPSINIILCYSPTSIWIHIHWLYQITQSLYGHKNSSLFSPNSEYVSAYTFCINIARYFQIYEHVCHNKGAISVQKVISCQHRNSSYENKTVSRPLYLYNENPHTWINGFVLKRAYCPQNRSAFIVHVHLNCFEKVKSKAFAIIFRYCPRPRGATKRSLSTNSIKCFVNHIPISIYIYVYKTSSSLTVTSF